MRGLHAGAISFVGIALLNGGNYAFHLVSARLLGPSPYGSLVALLTLTMLISLPLGGLQIAVAAAVARHQGAGEPAVIRSVYSNALAALTALGAIATLVLLPLVPLLAGLLNVSSNPAVAMTVLLTLPSVVTPVVWGLAQGLQRFGLLSAAMVGNALTRLAALALFAAVGLTVVGALGATLLGTACALAIPLWMLRRQLTRVRLHRLTAVVRGGFRQAMPVVLGLLAVTTLSTADVIVAKVSFESSVAGVYGAASLIGRVILYLPAAVVTVLLPKVASRSAAGRETRDILGASLLVTLAFCGAATLVYSLAPDTLMKLAVGSKYESGAGLLWMFAVAMSGYALLNVLLVYDLGRGSARAAWLLLAGAALQLAAYGVLHAYPRELLGVSIATAWTLLVAHELVVAPRLGSMLGVLAEPGAQLARSWQQLRPVRVERRR